MPFVFLLFVLVPIIEIAVLIQVGGAIGGWTTIGIVILTAILGTAMLRQQGMATLAKAQQRMGAGEMPAQQLLEGVLLLVGGVLLLTPGFITDAFGFACLIPFTREWMAKRLASRSLASVHVSGRSPFGAGQHGRADMGGNDVFRDDGLSGHGSDAKSTKNPSNRAPDVIDGDYRRID